MAISYPVTAPVSSIYPAQVELRANQAVALSQSPFTYQQQVISFSGGERWEMSVAIPAVRRDKAEPWVAFLTSLRGQWGTFLMGDPNSLEPQGTATSLSISGSAGDRTVSATFSGTLKAGDFFQLGSGSSTQLYKVLEDSSGASLEIWPRLRTSHSGASATLSSPKGHFRLMGNQTSWSINDNSAYAISFEAVEVI